MINVWAWPLGGPTDCRFCGGLGVVSTSNEAYFHLRAFECGDEGCDRYCRGCEAGEVARKRTHCSRCGEEGPQEGPLGLDCADPFYCYACCEDAVLSAVVAKRFLSERWRDLDHDEVVYKWEILPCIRCGKRGLHGDAPEPKCGCKVHHLPEVTGRVYFWEVGGFTKIGFTKRSTSNRLRELSTGSTHQGRLVHEIEGCAADERFLHLYFRTKRVRGEWFDLRLAMHCEQPQQLKRCSFCGGWCPMDGWDHCPASEAAWKKDLERDALESEAISPFRTVELAQ